MFADVEKGSTKPVGVTDAEDMLTSMSSGASFPSAGHKAASIAANVYNPTTAHAMPEVGTVVNAFTDPTIHRIPPGTETFGDALWDLPNDLGGWVTDWLDHLDFAGPIASLINVFSGGILQWLTVAFLGLKLMDLGLGMIQQNRGTVELINYRVSSAAYQPVTAFLQNHQVEVRDPVRDGEYTLIRIPAYHTRKAREAFEYLHKKTGLEYTTF